VPKENVPPTAVPKVERERADAAPAHVGPGDVDRRKTPHRRSARKTEYEPQHTLDDWDREPRRR
jgi:hypothetical protein